MQPKMKSIKQLPFVLCSTLLLTMTGINPSCATAQTNRVQVETLNEEQLYRPNFHFTPKKGWMNDPNGMFYANGTYHLFYQYYPDGNKWGPMHWGHAISKDLIKWQELPIAIYPDNDKYIFSGSAVVDNDNTSGLGNGKTAPIIAVYTLHDMTKEKQRAMDTESQDMAFSLDNGFTWKKFEQGNPIIKNPGIRDFRDPKMFRDDKHNQWIMVLAAQEKTQFYKSADLKKWEYLSDFGKDIGAHGGVWECPDFFEIKVEGTDETKWVLIQSLNPGGANGGSGTQYFVGDFDGTTFTLDRNFAQKIAKEKAVWLDYGKDNYAGVTWNNVPDSEGRKLMIGWMTNWDYGQDVPTYTWRGSMTIAREIKLVKKEKQYNIITAPVSEIKKYISKTVKKKKLSGKNKIELPCEKIDLTKAVLSFSLKDLKQDTYNLTLSNSLGESLTFGINNSDHYLFLDRSKSGKNDFSDKFATTVTKAELNEDQKKADFKIILDKTSIEIFYNDGEKVITETFFPTAPFTSLSASSNQGVEISNLVINQLKIN